MLTNPTATSARPSLARLTRRASRAGLLVALAILVSAAQVARADGFSDIRDITKMPTTPIQDVVLGETPFSPGTTGYVSKHLADLDAVPFAETVEQIFLTTEDLSTTVSTYKNMPISVVWRKPVSDSAPRRRPLTIYNYSNIALTGDGKTILLFGIPSRGLMMQFALVLKFHYKQKYHKDVGDNFQVSVENRGLDAANDAANKNYARLLAFFEDAKARHWAGIDYEKSKFLLVFGYKKVVDGVWDPLTKKSRDLAFTSNGWVGTFFAHKNEGSKIQAKNGGEYDYIVTLDSDTYNSYHVEVLAQNIAALVRFGKYPIVHIVLAGSAGYIGNEGNGDQQVAAAPEKYTFIYPKLKLASGDEVMPNLVGAILEKDGLIGPQASYTHTSVPSVLSETNAAMKTLRTQKITSVDMEFAYVADAMKELHGPDVSIACLITDYPWAAPAGVRLADKSDDDKKAAEAQFATQLGLAIGALVAE